MKTFRFVVWQPIGFADVEANSKDEAKAKVDEYGYDSEDDGIDFEPYCDGQEYEIR